MTDQIMQNLIDHPSTQYNPKIVDTDGTLLYDEFVVINVWELWYDWYLDIRENGIDEPWQLFFGRWYKYNQMHLKDFLRLYHTTYGTYDPLSNYDMTEQTLDARKKDDITDTTTPTGKTTTTSTISGKLTDTTSQYKTGLGSGGTETLTDKLVTDNESGSGNNARKTTTDLTYQSGTKTEHKTVHTNTQSGDYMGDTYTGYNEVLEHRSMRKGNIGVQSAQDLIQKEYDIRKYNILVEYVKQFFQLYGYYTGSVS